MKKYFKKSYVKVISISPFAHIRKCEKILTPPLPQKSYVIQRRPLSRSNFVTKGFRETELERESRTVLLNQSKQTVAKSLRFVRMFRRDECIIERFRPACLSKHIRNVQSFTRENRDSPTRRDARDSHVFVTSTEGIAAASCKREGGSLCHSILQNSFSQRSSLSPSPSFHFLLLMRRYEFYRGLHVHVLRARLICLFIRA